MPAHISVSTPDFTENGRRIFDLRYPRKDEDGSPAESPGSVITRVAANVSTITGLYAGMDKALSSAKEYDLPAEFPVLTAVRHGLAMGMTEEQVLAAVEIHGYSAWVSQAQKYADLISGLMFLPNSPTWTGAGTPLGQLAACFVLPISDDLGRKSDSIFSTLRNAALIQQTGGGNGFDFSDLRPANNIIRTSMGRASGPMGFLRVYNGAFGEIAQGGTRRGANMGVLRVDHPDIWAFIKAKVVEGEVSNFNLSVAITDAFMEAVAAGDTFDLTFKGEVYETIQARDLYDAIIENAWVMGDPGNLFIDRANDTNPYPARARLAATNPCGEQFLDPYSNCCLGSIAVQQFAPWRVGYTHESAEDRGPEFDWRGFKEAVVGATQFLDDVVDANRYVDEVPMLAEAAAGGRRIGLGIMGLADALAKMGMRYGGEEALDFTSQLMEFARYWSMRASIERAKERGAFHWIHNSIYDPALLARYGEGATVEVALEPSHQDYDPDGDNTIEMRLWSRPMPLVGHKMDFGRPECDWDVVRSGITSFGIRNACQFTVAPTGTISNVAGCEGSGCEPFFALAFERTVMQEGENIKLAFASDLFAEALRRSGLREDDIQVITHAVADNDGSCQGVEGVPAAVKHAFVVAADVTPEEHVRSQAAIQAWVDNSISKTINMPNEATKEDVATAYRLAYELGCKGITIYRQGSRDLEVLSTKRTEETSSPTTTIETTVDGTITAIEGWPEIIPLDFPPYAPIEGLAARVYPIETFYGKVQVTITELDEFPGRPFDVRLQVGKAGNDTNAHVEALGRMISLALRGGVHVDEVVKQLEGIGGANVHGFGQHRVRSVADGVAKLLRRRYIGAPTESAVAVYEQVRVAAVSERPQADTSMLCPNCGNASLVMESGCRHCDVRLGGCGEFSGCD